jgi:PAS domain S-box-containing protein
MTSSIPVNLHTHSIFSDGELTPEALANNLAAAGVRYAALTDHDTLEGLPRFQAALAKCGLAYLPGLELTTWFRGREAHLLAYGFDPAHPDLLATLLSIRQARSLEVHSIAGSLRKMGANHPAVTKDAAGKSAAPEGRLEMEAAIDLIHHAGGKAFWAHPLLFETDERELDACLAELKALGLDGLEAIYAPFSPAQRDSLAALAKRHDLLTCAGTDLHMAGGESGIEMPREHWNRFRGAVFASPTFTEKAPGAGKTVPGGAALRPQAGKSHHFRRRSYILRIFLPTLIAMGLFLAAIWGIILPSYEQSLLERKRELIRELTNSAWSILASYQRDEQNGLLTREQAQRLAVDRVEALRYGPEGKDYFWIQDMQPRMVMHPYRPDLNGQDVSDFTDPRGAPIFVEFASLVRREGEGYIDYVWQWKDDPERLEPKESYVKGFEPWGWVVGTGLYTDDVRAEITRLERSLVNASLAISGAVVLLLVFVLQQSLRIERERQEVLDNLRDSTERYHSLVEATTEGTLLVLEGRCRYANPTFLGMTGYTARQLEFLDLPDLLPREAENAALWECLDGARPQECEALEGILRRADGGLVDCVLALNPIGFAEQHGFILLARDLAQQAAMFGEEAPLRAAHSAPLGIFRARAARRAPLVEMNPAAREFFSQPQPALADLFAEPAEFEALLQSLQNGAEVNHRILHIATPEASTRFLALSARLARDERTHSAYIDGVLEDVSAARRQEAAREALIEKFQASLLFLHEPISKLGRDALVCSIEESVSQVTRRMTERNVTAALVASTEAGGAMLGIVTDRDLRARVLAENLPLETPIRTVMSAPLTKIPEDSLVYEALMRMEEKGVRHLAVEDRNGQIVNVVDYKSLVQFQRYGPIVLAREIERAANPAEVAHHAGRTPPLVKSLLDSSARPRHVTNMLASLCDSSTARLVELAVAELGEPPAEFAFIAMGSQGRQEQTLVTDQDNGIIYAQNPGGNPAEVNRYFLRLGEKVCQGLDAAGYPYCRGGVMASQPRWCRSLSEWVAGFSAWIQKAEPQEIIDLSIFFDFRTVYGQGELTRELRLAIHNALAHEPAFFHHFAQNALAFKPPFRLLGSIYLGGGATEHAGEINLKDAMMPMVGFARLYALQHRVPQTHTLERIEALTERGIIQPASRDEIVAAYDFLMQLRLQTQASALQAGKTPANIVHPSRLGYIQKELLNQAFAQIAAVQKKVSYDFLGGG